MRVTLVTTIYPPDIGGPATYAYEVSRRLRRRGHHVAVVTSSLAAQPSPGLYLPPKGTLALPLLGAGATYGTILANLLRAGAQSDVFLVQNPLYLGLLTLLAGRVLGKSVVLRFPGDKAWERAHGSGQTTKTLHDFLASPEGNSVIRRLLRLQRFVLHQVDSIIAPSQYVKSALSVYYGVPRPKTKVIYHSVDASDYQLPCPQLLAGLRRPFIASAGRFVPHKRIDSLVKALPLVAEQHPTVNLLIAGEGPGETTLRALAHELGIADRVHFLGPLPQRQAIGLLKTADVFVIPSLWESLSHVAIEALAVGTPVVGTRIDALKEVLEDGVSGLLVPLGSERAVAEAVLRILGDGVLRTTLVNNALARVRQLFCWEKNLEALEQILSQTVSNKRAAWALPAELRQ